MNIEHDTANANGSKPLDRDLGGHLNGHLALFQPDIPQNTGAIMRLASCFAMPLHIIEPCGFLFGTEKFKRTAMDYIDDLTLTRHDDWQNFCHWQQNINARAILFTTHATKCYDEFEFQQNDILLFGSESSGVPDYVHQYCAHQLRIPIRAKARSLNLAMSAAIATAHFCHQRTEKEIEHDQ